MWIDLRSDTVTQLTKEMRQAMALAEVGNDVYRGHRQSCANYKRYYC